jgi:hypothetical protein
VRVGDVRVGEEGGVYYWGMWSVEMREEMEEEEEEEGKSG